ncbi:histidine phosphatase superfamily [Geopyxis carbonaria]|nr:histidine phosphatase superfamily [Geopyxis carbonaria]
MPRRTPRVILLRHGETAWTLTGAHTSTTDLSLTPHGALTVSRTARTTVGRGLQIDPAHLGSILVSPRARAAETLALLSLPASCPAAEVHEGVQEWRYGDFEGLTPRGIRARASQGQEWDIWRDGCEGGESAAAMSARVDSVIDEIRERQRPWFDNKEEEGCYDVLIVSHGHFSRCFLKRWLGYPLEEKLVMLIEPGGIGVLSYAHNSIEEPAFVLGGVYCRPDGDETVE